MTELKIGEQIWTVNNLDVTTYRNGDPIPCIEDAEEWRKTKTGAWCYFDNDYENSAKYGKIYNYHAVIDPRGLAPIGYRIPQHYDWLLIQKFGSHLKSKNDWDEKEVLDFYIPFNAMPGGYRNSCGKFCYRNEAVGWWASTESDVNNQGNIAHWFYKNEPQLGWKPFFENDGFYVRCLRESYKAIELYFNDNLQLQFKTISIKYSSSTTLQDVLNLLYSQFLTKAVNPNTYGLDWLIQIYDGERLDILNKIGITDNRTFESVLKSQTRRRYRLIISRT